MHHSQLNDLMIALATIDHCRSDYKPLEIDHESSVLVALRNAVTATLARERDACDDPVMRCNIDSELRRASRRVWGDG